MLPRTLFYALVAVNIVLALLLSLPYLGVAPRWTPSGEPERLSKQLVPDSIRVLPPVLEQSSAKTNEPEKIVTEAPREEQSRPEPVAQSVSSSQENEKPEESRCVVLKGLQEELATSISARVRKSGKLQLSTSGTTNSVSYWVHIPADGGKEAAERRIEILERNGFSDHFIVRESGENQYAVSLGLYRTEELAKRRLESLQKAGIKTAKITTRENNVQRMELKGPKKAVESLLATLSSLNKGKAVAHENCQSD